jgi:hypothetical protein
MRIASLPVPRANGACAAALLDPLAQSEECEHGEHDHDQSDNVDQPVHETPLSERIVGARLGSTQSDERA